MGRRRQAVSAAVLALCGRQAPSESDPPARQAQAEPGRASGATPGSPGSGQSGPAPGPPALARAPREACRTRLLARSKAASGVRLRRRAEGPGWQVITKGNPLLYLRKSLTIKGNPYYRKKHLPMIQRNPLGRPGQAAGHGERCRRHCSLHGPAHRTGFQTESDPYLSIRSSVCPESASGWVDPSGHGEMRCLANNALMRPVCQHLDLPDFSAVGRR